MLLLGACCCVGVGVVGALLPLRVASPGRCGTLARARIGRARSPRQRKESVQVLTRVKFVVVSPQKSATTGHGQGGQGEERTRRGRRRGRRRET